MKGIKLFVNGPLENHHAASNCDFQFGHQTSHPNSWSLLLRPHLFMCVQSGVQQLGRKVIICLFVDSLLRERRGEGRKERMGEGGGRGGEREEGEEGREVKDGKEEHGTPCW